MHIQSTGLTSTVQATQEPITTQQTSDSYRMNPQQPPQGKFVLHFRDMASI